MGLKQANQETVFSSGHELAGVVLGSNLLQRSSEAIQKLENDPEKKNIRASSSSPFSLAYKAYDDEIIAFDCKVGASSELSSTLKECPPEFGFLQTNIDNPFSINEEAITLFGSLLHQDQDLFKRFEKPSKPVIITGHSLGGSVASLFCLYLLDKIQEFLRKQEKEKNTSKVKVYLPICITFGSPLVGNDGLRNAINRSGWNTRFLHIISNADLIPCTFLSTTTTNNYNSYKPFGTFFMCSPSGSACFDDPDSVLNLLVAMGGSHQLPNLIMDYGKLLECLTDQMIVSNGASPLPESRGDPFRAGIILQLNAIGVNRIQEEDTLITHMEKREKKIYQEHKKRKSVADKKLNDSKMNLARFEWYKKISSPDQVSMGYYDCYKSKPYKRDIYAVKFKVQLTKYWEDVIYEADRKPRKEGVAPLATRLLFGGTTYRRMVEPLDIAEHYKRGKRNYCTEGRPRYYRLLQKWLEEEEGNAETKGKSKTRDKPASLTEDSCFWAEVEEAIILTKSLENEKQESTIEKLKKFEGYVMGLIKNFMVSPEIFLEKGTFMQWWNKYKTITVGTHESSLADYMKKRSYQNYIKLASS